MKLRGEPMKLPLFQIDAFTSRLFAGNPAAVVILDEWLPDHVLAAVAAENNLSETAFVIPRADQAVPLRWFTPTIEVDLCGHATLAAAHVLLNHYFRAVDTVKFATRSGELSVARQGDLLCMEFPAMPPKPIEVTDTLASALGAWPRVAGGTRRSGDLRLRRRYQVVAARFPRNCGAGHICDYRVRAGREGGLRVSLLRSARGHSGGPRDRFGALHLSPLLVGEAEKDQSHRQATFRPRRRVALRDGRRARADLGRHGGIPARRDQRRCVAAEPQTQ